MNPQQLIEAAEAKVTEANYNLTTCAASLNTHRERTGGVPNSEVILLSHAQAGVSSAHSALAMAKAGVSMLAAEEARSTEAITAAVAAKTAALRMQRDELNELVSDILRNFTEAGHPGQPCHRTGWISDKTIARWRDTADRIAKPDSTDG